MFEPAAIGRPDEQILLQAQEVILAMEGLSETVRRDDHPKLCRIYIARPRYESVAQIFG